MTRAAAAAGGRRVMTHRGRGGKRWSCHAAARAGDAVAMAKRPRVLAMRALDHRPRGGPLEAGGNKRAGENKQAGGPSDQSTDLTNKYRWLGAGHVVKVRPGPRGYIAGELLEF